MDFLTANDRPGEHAPSWYAATAAPAPEHPPVHGEITADVCIVGGGYSGLSAALHLAERGIDVVLLEAHRIGWGASGRNGGQLGSGMRLSQGELEAQFGQDSAHALWRMGEDAKALAKDLIARHDIACDLTPGVLHADHKPRFAADTREDVRRLRETYGYEDIRVVERDELCEMLGTRVYHCGALDLGAAHLHPLNYALGLGRTAAASGARLHERSRVTAIDHGESIRIQTGHGTVRANRLILACNGYLGGLEPRVARKVMPINNFILATEPLGEAGARALIRDNVAVADSKFVVNYFRLSPDWRLLFGGTESYSYRFAKDIASAVRRPMLQIFPQLAQTRIDYAWGGTLAITMNRMPHFARLAPNALSISGYSGHGVAMATLAGKLAAEALNGQPDGFDGFDAFARIAPPSFPGGPRLRSPLLKLAMSWYALRDRL